MKPFIVKEKCAAQPDFKRNISSLRDTEIIHSCVFRIARNCQSYRRRLL